MKQISEKLIMNPDPIRQINALMAGLVDVDSHEEAKRKLLDIIADATGYRYGFLVEAEAPFGRMIVTSSNIPHSFLARARKLTGLELIGYEFEVDFDEVLTRPDIEVFSSFHEFFPQISKPAGKIIDMTSGLRQIVSIRQRTTNEYLGAANFVALKDGADQPLLEYLCINHLAYALRLMREQKRFVLAAEENTHTLEARVEERTKALESLLDKSQAAENEIKKLYTDLANTQTDLQSSVREFNYMLEGLKRVSEASSIEEVYASLLDTLKDAFSAEAALIMMRQEDGSYKGVACSTDQLCGRIWPPGEFFKKVRTGNILVASSLETIPEWLASTPNLVEMFRSALHLPLHTVLTEAILVCFHSAPDHFSRKHVDLGARFLAFSGQAFRNVELLNAIQQERDDLERAVAERTENLTDLNEQLNAEIQERIAAERTAKENALRYRSLFERSNDAIFFINLEGQHTATNQQAADMLGYSLEEMQHLTMREIVVPRSYDRAQSVLERLMQGESFEPYLRYFRKKDGSEIPVEISISLVSDEETGKPQYIQSVVRDITSRLEAEENLKSIAKFPAENPYPIIRVLEDGKIVYANESALPLMSAWGLEVEDYFNGTLYEEFCNVDDPSGARFDREWTVGLNTYLFTVVPFPDSGYINIYGKDVTEERRLDRLKAEFIASVSHELRTPLASILGFTELLLDPDTGDMNPIQKEFLATVDDSGRYLLRLVNDLLDVTRMEVGRLSLAMEKVSIPDLFARAQSNVVALVMERGVLIHAEVEPGLPEIMADPSRLEQVLVNLLSNSIKFSRSSAKVEMLAEKADGENVRFRIRDYGSGMLPEDVGKVFEKFYRGQNTSGTTIGGTGLGLYIARSIVEAHGGTISASSVLGEGSVFDVILPVDASMVYKSVHFE